MGDRLEHTGGADALKLPRRVVFANAPELLEALARELRPGASSGVDLADCVEFDSSLIGLLLELARRARAGGGALRLRNPSLNLRKLAGLYGVEELLLVDRD